MIRSLIFLIALMTGFTAFATEQTTIKISSTDVVYCSDPAKIEVIKNAYEDVQKQADDINTANPPEGSAKEYWKAKVYSKISVKGSNINIKLGVAGGIYWSNRVDLNIVGTDCVIRQDTASN